MLKFGAFNYDWIDGNRFITKGRVIQLNDNETKGRVVHICDEITIRGRYFRGERRLLNTVPYISLYRICVNILFQDGRVYTTEEEPIFYK